MIISDDRLQKSLTYLAETDQPAAVARAKYEALKDQSKTILNQAFLDSSAPTVREREASAHVSQAYRDHIEKIKDAFADYEIMRNKRITESAIIDVWRSLNSNRRQGIAT